MVVQISDHWLGLLLVWASDCKVFSRFRWGDWPKILSTTMLGWVSSYCCVYFKFMGLFFSCGFYYFSGFMGLIRWRIWWRKWILNEFLHVYLLRKCNKRKENIDYFNFMGNLHVLSRRTWRTCYFVLPKIMKRKERKNFNYSF